MGFNLQIGQFFYMLLVCVNMHCNIYFYKGPRDIKLSKNIILDLLFKMDIVLHLIYVRMRLKITLVPVGSKLWLHGSFNLLSDML